MPSKFQIMKAKNGKFYFHLLSPNGEVILSSQMYASKVTAKKGIASVQANAADLDQYEVRTYPDNQGSSQHLRIGIG